MIQSKPQTLLANISVKVTFSHFSELILPYREKDFATPDTEFHLVQSRNTTSQGQPESQSCAPEGLKQLPPLSAAGSVTISSLLSFKPLMKINSEEKQILERPIKTQAEHD